MNGSHGQHSLSTISCRLIHDRYFSCLVKYICHAFWLIFFCEPCKIDLETWWKSAHFFCSQGLCRCSSCGVFLFDLLISDLIGAFKLREFHAPWARSQENLYGLVQSPRQIASRHAIWTLRARLIFLLSRRFSPSRL